MTDWKEIAAEFGYPGFSEIRLMGEEIAKLREELGTERMRLAACGVAAMSNTVEAAAKRIARVSPYWSASYGDVCSAVDREMKLRAQLAVVVKKLETTRAYLEVQKALNVAAFKERDNALEGVVDFVKERDNALSKLAASEARELALLGVLKEAETALEHIAKLTCTEKDSEFAHILQVDIPYCVYDALASIRAVLGGQE